MRTGRVQNYNQSIKADVKRRMRLHQRQCMAGISEELIKHVIKLYKSRKNWRLQMQVLPTTETQWAGALQTSQGGTETNRIREKEVRTY